MLSNFRRESVQLMLNYYTIGVGETLAGSAVDANKEMFKELFGGTKTQQNVPMPVVDAEGR